MIRVSGTGTYDNRIRVREVTDPQIVDPNEGRAMGDLSELPLPLRK